ncbi:MAG: NfeD family protein [Hyphomonas sp.]|uniref:NfeD family protein n=1 Tax=Hyphomonas sp. TaxID=87 RepID=UPI0034A08754
MEQLLSQITWWHWLVLALILFGAEMSTGTFDLLMASISAALTAAFAAFAPESATAWHTQVLVFGVAAVVLIVASRFLFPGMRKAAPEHPTLNKRMVQLVGQRGEITREFSGGQGQVKIGDTVWGAEAAAGEGILHIGDAVVVESTRSNLAVVRKA